MSDKKTLTIAELKKQIKHLERELIKEEARSVANQALYNISKKDAENYKIALTQSRKEYERACAVAKHLSSAINRLVEE